MMPDRTAVFRAGTRFRVLTLSRRTRWTTFVLLALLISASRFVAAETKKRAPAATKNASAANLPAEKPGSTPDPDTVSGAASKATPAYRLPFGPDPYAP